MMFFYKFGCKYGSFSGHFAYKRDFSWIEVTLVLVSRSKFKGSIK